MKIRQLMILSLLLISFGLAYFPSDGLAATGIPFYDDFEDGDHDGWGISTSGGTGGSDVDTGPNSSLMAAAWHNGSLFHALVNNFNYNLNYDISFDMQATAITGTQTAVGTRHAFSGVKFSLLNNFGSPLGETGLIYATTSSLLGPNDMSIDQFLHDYDFTMGEIASAAGLDPAAPIEKLSMVFIASAQSGTTDSRSRVWFDNVSVAPEPISTLLFLTGGGTLFMFGRGRKKIKA